MAATGFTPIQLYRTTTASAQPSAGNLADGELAINLTDKKLYAKDASNNVFVLADASSGGTTATNLAGGAAGSVPYQTGANATTFLGIGTAAQVLQVNSGATAPEWVNTSGTGDVARTTSPSFTTPSLGAATALSINSLTLTTSTGTFTLANGKTLTVNNSLTLSGTDATTMTFPSTSATIARTDAAQTFTGTQTVQAAATQDAVALAGRAGGTSSYVSTLTPTTLSASRTVTLPDADTTVPVATQVLTFTGPTAGRTITLPDANFTVARSDAAQSFTGTQTFLSNPVLDAGTANGVLYLNGSKVVTSGSALTFDGIQLGVSGGTGLFRLNASSSDYNVVRLAVAGTNYGSFGVGTGGEFVWNANGLHLWNVNSSEQMRLTSTGLGIGNSSPTAKLDVTGTAAISGAVTLSGGTANGVAYLNGSKVVTSGSALTFDGTSLGVGTSDYGNAGSINVAVGVPATATGGLQLWSTTSGSHYMQFGDATAGDGPYRGAVGYNHTLDALQFFASGSEKMALTSTGLGIGANNPVSKLHVSNAAAATRITITDDVANGRSGYIESNFSDALVIGTTSGVRGIRFSPDNTPRMFLDTSGNLGLGASPAASNFSGSYTSLLVKGNSADKIGTVIAQSFGSINATNIEMFASDSANEAGLLVKGASTAMNFYTGSVPDKRMTLDSSGNLGLGVTPSAWTSYKALQVASTGGALSSSSSSDLEITTNAYYNAGWLSQGAGVDSSRYRLNAGTHAWFTAPSEPAGDPISFTQAMTLDASGNLGIGATSPLAKLDVVGGDGDGIQYRTGTRAVGIGQVASEAAVYWGSTTALTFFSGSERARIPAAGGMVVGTAALATAATDGFLYVPTCAGTPTGTPTTQTGTAPIVVDTTNNKLYFYSGGQWRDAGP
jgi:hypothetical protein